METGDRVLQQAVRLGDALVLAQMLEPRRHEKCLDKAAFLCGVLEYSPSVGAITTALACQFIHAGEEGIAVFWSDPVFHGHQHRSTIVLDLA